MSDTRVYEVEQRLSEDASWVFMGNLEVTDHAMLEAFTERAEQNEWPDGEYRLNHWDTSYASGSFYLITLKSETRRTAQMSPQDEEAAV